MSREVVELLLPVPAGLLVDCTVGAGGHAALLLDARPTARCSVSTATPTLSPRPPHDSGASVTGWRWSRESSASCERWSANARRRSWECSWIWAYRARRSTDPSGASPTASMHPSTCAWTAPVAHRRAGRERLRRRRAGRNHRPQRRGALRPPRRAPSSRRDRCTPRASSCRHHQRDPHVEPPIGRPSGASHIPGDPHGGEPRAAEPR